VIFQPVAWLSGIWRWRARGEEKQLSATGGEGIKKGEERA